MWNSFSEVVVLLSLQRIKSLSSVSCNRYVLYFCCCHQRRRWKRRRYVGLTNLGTRPRHLKVQCTVFYLRTLCFIYGHVRGGGRLRDEPKESLHGRLCMISPKWFAIIWVFHWWKKETNFKNVMRPLVELNTPFLSCVLPLCHNESLRNFSYEKILSLICIKMKVRV